MVCCQSSWDLCFQQAIELTGLFVNSATHESRYFRLKFFHFRFVTRLQAIFRVCWSQVTPNGIMSQPLSPWLILKLKHRQVFYRLERRNSFSCYIHALTNPFNHRPRRVNAQLDGFETGISRIFFTLLTDTTRARVSWWGTTIHRNAIPTYPCRDDTAHTTDVSVTKGGDGVQQSLLCVLSLLFSLYATTLCNAMQELFLQSLQAASSLLCDALRTSSENLSVFLRNARFPPPTKFSMRPRGRWLNVM